MNITEALERLVGHEDLTAAEAEAVMGQIMAGAASEAQIGALLMGLRMKGETRAEIVGSARAMRAHVTPVPVRSDRDALLDTCGTGGDGSGSFNISTTVAFVAAGAGVKVAKHGNRAASSRCGSADVLAELGVNLDLEPEQMARCVDEVGIGFLFAVKLHPAMRHAIGPRREMKLRTIFNVLGPLANPAGARRQLFGVYAPQLTETLAQVLDGLGAISALVVHGYGGLDELTTGGPNRVSQLRDGELRTFTLEADALGFPPAGNAELAGGDAATNAAILRAVLDGREQGARRDVVLLNAAAALLAAGAVADMRAGLARAREAIDSGGALAKLEALVAMSRSLADG